MVSILFGASAGSRGCHPLVSRRGAEILSPSTRSIRHGRRCIRTVGPNRLLRYRRSSSRCAHPVRLGLDMMRPRAAQPARDHPTRLAGFGSFGVPLTHFEQSHSTSRVMFTDGHPNPDSLTIHSPVAGRRRPAVGSSGTARRLAFDLYNNGRGDVVSSDATALRPLNPLTGQVSHVEPGPRHNFNASPTTTVRAV